jgi:hypothetical protein
MYVRLRFGNGAELTLFEWPEVHRFGTRGAATGPAATRRADRPRLRDRRRGGRVAALGIVLDLDDGSGSRCR